MKFKLLMCGLAAMTMASAVLADTFIPNKTVDIIFTTADGSPYCDGMHLVINQNTQQVLGKHTGCVNSAITGVVGSFSKNGAGIAMTTIYDGFGTYSFVIDDSSKKWEVYNFDGVLLNSGKYKVGVAGVADGGPRTID